MMLTRFIKTQLFIFLALTVAAALLALECLHLRLPSLAGVGQYPLKVDLPLPAVCTRPPTSPTEASPSAGSPTWSRPRRARRPCSASATSTRSRPTRVPTCTR